MVYRGKTFRWAMAWVMALWVPAWCCCSAQSLFAKSADTHVRQSVPAEKDPCCAKSAAEQDTPQPIPAGSHAKNCQCDQHLAVTAPTAEVQAPSGTADQFHPTLDLLTSPFIATSVFSLATTSQPEAPGTPCADSLLTRHCMLTI